MSDWHYALKRALTERIASLEHEIANGSAGTYAEYQRMCGHVTGLKEAIAELQDLHERVEID